MTTQKRRIASVVLMAIAALCGTLWIFSTDPADRARAFDSPLPRLALQSPIATPPLRPSLPRSEVRSSQPTALPRLTFLSPVSVPGMQPRAYLPVVMQKYPLYLASGLKGLAVSEGYGNLSYDVWYNWAPSPDITDPKFVRMVKCPTDYRLYTAVGKDLWNRIEDIWAAADSDKANHMKGRVWLIFNEPDNLWGECGTDDIDRNNQVTTDTVNTKPEWAADRYSFIYDQITSHDPNARVFAGGFIQISSTMTINWWNTFLNRLDANQVLYKLDGVHLHAYPYWATGCPYDSNSDPDNGHWCMPELIQGLNNWYSMYHGVGKRLEHKPIWITEAGTPPYRGYFTDYKHYSKWDTQVFILGRDNIMAPLATWFAGSSNPGYNALYWYTPYCNDYPQDDNWCQTNWWITFLYTSTGGMTSLGDYWNQFRP